MATSPSPYPTEPTSLVLNAPGRTRLVSDVQTIALLREDRDALQRCVGELEAEVNRLRST